MTGIKIQILIPEWNNYIVINYRLWNLIARIVKYLNIDYRKCVEMLEFNRMMKFHGIASQLENKIYSIDNYKVQISLSSKNLIYHQMEKLSR